MIRLLLELDEDGQRLVAELLADCGEEGYQILREAAGEDEIKVRRAATFGLAPPVPIGRVNCCRRWNAKSRSGMCARPPSTR